MICEVSDSVWIGDRLVSGLDLTLESERQVHRFEVINGVGGRLRWTLDDKARIGVVTLVLGTIVRWLAVMVCGHSRSLPGADKRASVGH